jgi:hypothetical protein
MTKHKVETYGVDWGSTFGGAILYKEPEEFVRTNRRRTIAASALLLGFGIFFFISLWAVFTYLKASDNLHAVGIALFAGFFFIILGILAFREARVLRPFIVYERGFMLRLGKKPFIPFKDVYQVEEERTPRGNSPFTMITLANSDYIIITGDPFIKHVHACLKEYEKARNIIKQQVNREGVRHMEWKIEAENFMSRVQYVKGPIRASAENVAREKGRAYVDINFIASYWKEIAKKAGNFGHHLKKVAKREFKR